MDTLFYAEPGTFTSTHIRLIGDEAKHASRVLRCQVGDPMQITDGLGTLFYGFVESVTRTEVVVCIEKRTHQTKESPRKVLAIGWIRKRERLEFLLEKATELGTDFFTVFTADHSEKGSIRMERLSAVLLRAMKQSKRTFLPGISMARSLDEVLGNPEVGDRSSSRTGNLAGSRRLIYGDMAAVNTKIDRVDRVEQTKELVGLIGPEGGWSSRELTLLHDAHAEPILLGAYRLRTETAGIIMADRLANANL